ncbi:MAG: hypothetical protein HYT87_03040 [Nitrospirae bacterium]|nr:hypothetical protein [Nitrospirota bacterium]
MRGNFPGLRSILFSFLLLTACASLLTLSSCGDPFSRAEEAGAVSGGGGGGTGDTGGGAGGGAGGTEYSFSKDVLPVLQASCNCHAAGIGSYKVTGVAANDYAGIKALVNVDSPADSKLIKKGTGGDGHIGGAALGADKAAIVQAWVQQGAANN